MFRDKTLLITGGTGSFGNSVLQRFLHTDIREIRIFSRDEKKQHDMRVSLKNGKVKFYIGDVRDIKSVEEAMQGVDYVFHLAAMVGTPTMTFFAETLFASSKRWKSISAEGLQNNYMIPENTDKRKLLFEEIKRIISTM